MAFATMSRARTVQVQARGTKGAKQAVKKVIATGQRSADTLPAAAGWERPKDLAHCQGSAAYCNGSAQSVFA